MIDGITRDILEQRDNIENQRNREFNSNREALIKKQEKEIERLNNIIDGLEKWLKTERDYYFDNYYYSDFNAYGSKLNDVLDKLNELKGDNK